MSNALVIIPTFNERENIQLVIDAVLALPKDFDILIVDDGSPDGTAEIVANLQSKYNTPQSIRLHLLQRTGKQGLGTAYISLALKMARSSLSDQGMQQVSTW